MKHPISCTRTLFGVTVLLLNSISDFSALNCSSCFSSEMLMNFTYSSSRCAACAIWSPIWLCVFCCLSLNIEETGCCGEVGCLEIMVCVGLAYVFCCIVNYLCVALYAWISSCRLCMIVSS